MQRREVKGLSKMIKIILSIVADSTQNREGFGQLAENKLAQALNQLII
jgi:hypothetical protein